MLPPEIARRLRAVLKRADAQFEADGWNAPQMAYGHLSNEVARIAEEIEGALRSAAAYQRELCRTKNRLAEIKASGRGRP